MWVMDHLGRALCEGIKSAVENKGMLQPTASSEQRKGMYTIDENAVDIFLQGMLGGGS